MRGNAPSLTVVKNKGELADPESRSWTRPDEYLGALARRRTARKKREPVRRRTQTDQPHFLLSTLPFLLLFGALLVITIGMVALAWPGADGARSDAVEIARGGVRPAPDGAFVIVMRPRAVAAQKDARRPSRS
jgi:hypothetical protein